MTPADTKSLIAVASQDFLNAVPALKQLKLAVKLDLQAKGDHQIYRVAFPGPHIDKAVDGSEKVEITIQRAEFNKLIDKPTVSRWIKAYELGLLRISGETPVLKLIASVIDKHQRRHSD